ncbi:DoxX-like family protein [Acinetobacter piscicola]|uniref:DoxX-like family protein n=1 Tax=Acinetobacter piscicola TaxID=2006115 RepID=UPI000B7D0868|nr:DoxX-like family protein [Acinetobacter piscicola]
MQIAKSLRHVLFTIHSFLAILWIYQGLVPKIIYKVIEEQQFWQFTGIQLLSIPRLIELSGLIEIIFGISFLIFRPSKNIHYLNIIAMLFFWFVVGLIYPHYFVQAFNPFVMNFAMMGLSVVAIQLMSQNTNTQKSE